MRNSLQKRLAQRGWTGRELSDFLKKHGIERNWKTILNDVKKGDIVFYFKKDKGHIVFPEETAKKYIRYILENKKKNIESTGRVDEIVKNLNKK